MSEDGSVRRKGVVLVLCAPSGAGKSTLVGRLTEEFGDFAFSVSYTTRPPRPGEQDGREYFFVDRERFDQLVGEEFFAEWAEVYGNRYGTPAEPVREHLEAGRDVLFDIDVQGAKQLRAVFPDGVYVFILPPSLEELHTRLLKRGTDNEAVIDRRLHSATAELVRAGEFDFLVYNDDLDQAYAELRVVYLAGRVKTPNRLGLLRHVLGDFRGWSG